VPVTAALSNRPLTVGRASGNDLVIAHRSVSARHAELHFDGEQFLLRDLSSANGTFVNGERVTSATLQDGDTVHLGPVALKFDNGQLQIHVELEPGDPTPDTKINRKPALAAALVLVIGLAVAVPLLVQQSDDTNLTTALPETPVTTAPTTPESNPPTSTVPVTTVAPTTSRAPATTATQTTVAATTTAAPTTTLVPTTAVPTTTTAPTTTTKTPAEIAAEAILTSTYQWGVYSDQTKRLQELLAVPTDGFYGHGTRTIHVATLVGLGLSTEGVPAPIPTTTQPPPTTAAATTTSAPPITTTTIQIVTTTTTPTTTLWQTSTAGYMPEWGSGNYSFYAEAGDTVQVELVANGFNPLITLRHPDVWSVIFDNPDSTTASLSAGLCLGGDYTLHVSGEVPTDHGNYEWTVTLTNRNFDLSSCPYGSYPMINGWVAGYVAVFLERPCIADGDLSDCPPGTIGEVNQWFGPGSILG